MRPRIISSIVTESKVDSQSQFTHSGKQKKGKVRETVETSPALIRFKSHPCTSVEKMFACC